MVQQSEELFPVEWVEVCYDELYRDQLVEKKFYPNKQIIDPEDYARVSVILAIGQWLYGTDSELERIVPYYDIQGNHRLYKEFIDLDCTRSSILKFARRYGSLGVDTTRRFTPIGFSENEREFFTPDFIGDTDYEWYKEIIDLKTSVQWYQLVRAGKYRILSDAIKPVHPVRDSDKEKLLSKGLNDRIRYGLEVTIGNYHKIFPVYDNEPKLIRPFYEMTNKIGPGVYIYAAKHILQYMISEKLIAHTSQLAVYNHQAKRMMTLPWACSLLGELWLQFTNEVCGTPRYNKICPGCGQPFHSSRSNARACSPRCRMRLSRKKDDPTDPFAIPAT